MTAWVVLHSAPEWPAARVGAWPSLAVESYWPARNIRALVCHCLLALQDLKVGTDAAGRASSGTPHSADASQEDIETSVRPLLGVVVGVN
jgi:hypothetical protein